MKFFFFIFCTTLLYGSVNVPLSFDLSLGYREDNLRLKIYNPSTTFLKEKYKNLSFLESGFTIRTIQRDFYLYAGTTYAAFGKGDIEEGPISLSFASATPTFDFSSSASSWQALGLFGYCVNITPDRYYSIILIPCVGYAGLWEWITKKNPKQASQNFGIDDNSFFSISSPSNQKEKFRWNGFIAGGDIKINPGGDFWFDIFYGYHFLRLREDFLVQYQYNTFDIPNTLTESSFTTLSGTFKTHSGKGHSGKLQGSYHFHKNWEATVLGKIFYFTSHIRHNTVQTTTETTFPSSSTTTTADNKKFKLRQLSLSFLLQFTYKI